MMASSRSSDGLSKDCTDLYKEGKKFLTIVRKVQGKVEASLSSLCSTRSRHESLLAPINVGMFKTLHDVESVLEDAEVWAAIRTWVTKLKKEGNN